MCENTWKPAVMEGPQKTVCDSCDRACEAVAGRIASARDHRPDSMQQNENNVG